MEKTLIFGHKKPDTDSVTASIALSYLKNYYMDETNSIYEGLKYMNENEIGTLPIVNDENKLVGIVSLKDISKAQFENENTILNTSYKNIIDTINAEEILKFDEEIKGELLIASYRSTTFIENININENTILMVGDRHSIIEYAIKSNVKMIILTGNAQIKEEHLEMAKKNKINVVRTQNHTLKTSRKIELANYLKELTLTDDVVTFNENGYVNDFVDIANKRKFSNYPIINDKNICLGMLRFSDINDKKRKKVILVDHNEASQSVDGLEEADIVGIVDHHKIGTIGTTLPINFRNMPVGSTNTIIYMLFKENNIEIPSHIAGLMLSGIISDTLLFKSPTTTEIDKEIVKDLAKIANVDYEKFGMDMLKAGASLKGKTKEEILYSDFKNFTIDGKKVGVGQVVTLNIDEIEKEKDEYIKLINNVAENNDYHIVALFATDIIKNGSYIYYNDNAKEVLDNCFDVDEFKQGCCLDGIVSRKKQMIPNIMDAIENK